jgi:chromosomal replication initiation ATPase DnaA
MNGLHKKVPESQSASSASKRSQKPSRNNNKPERRQRTDEDVAEVIRELDHLEVRAECEKIAKARGVLLRAALGPGRTKCVTLARDDIIAFLVKRFAYSSPETGRLLRMNHATVLCSMHRTKERSGGGGG